MAEEIKNFGIKIQRKSNLELLRIICMFLIVAHHIVVHGGAINMEISSNKYLALLLIPGGKLGFDCFLALSMWFLVEQTFKTERFLKVWFEVLFYSISISALIVFLGGTFTLRNWFSVLFPIAGNSHGFAASYLAFYLLLPFLSKISNNISKKQAGWLVAVLLYLEVGTQIIGNINNYFQPIKSELLLFVMFYFIALYLKRYPLKLLDNKLVMASIVFLAWTYVYSVYYLIVNAPNNKTISFLLNISNDE